MKLLSQNLHLIGNCIWAVGALMFAALPLYAADDITPPEISNVQVIEVSENEVTIIWETDEDADSLINYGLQEDYGIVRQPLVDRTTHSMTLSGLDPGRVYYFRVISSDDNGNQGISADYQVLTEGETSLETGKGEAEAEGEGAGKQAGETNRDTPVISPDTTPTPETVQEIVEQIQQIQSPEVLQEILNETVKAIAGVTEDLTIIGPPTVIPETTTALVKWTTDREADSEVLFSSAGSYTGGNYEFSQANTLGPVNEHEVRLIGLEPFTEYHFKVRSTDGYGITGESLDYTFKTKAALPEIRNLRIEKVEEDSATLAWDTATPAKALIEYQDLTTGEQSSKGRPSLQTAHQMRISDLTLGTRYLAFVIAENAGGDRVKSQPITFITVRDREPPIISNVTNESTLFPGSEARIQTIIEWLTDEPSYCTLSYREGITAGVEPVLREPEDSSHTERHVEVIVDFAPATVYQFWLTCSDEQGNAVDSENFVLFTPIQERNIIDIIIENFENTFGWIKNITGGN